MKPDIRALRKLKRKYSKNPDDRGVALVKKLLLSYSPGWLIVWVLRKYFVKSDYKAARESTKFFELSNMTYGAGKRLKTQRLLMIALRLLGDRLPKSYISLLRSAIAGTLKDPPTRNSLSNSILSATKEIQVNVFDASHWYQLSRGLFSLGYFRAAWVARENSLDLSISESLIPGANSTALQRGIEVNIERGLPESDDFLTHSYLDVKDSFNSEHASYFSIVNHTSAKFQSATAVSENDGEHVFHEMIKGRSVAIVGPSPIQGEYGTEIDAHEIVIRIKFAGRENLPEKKFLGERCDVNFYGNSELASILKLGSDQFVHETLRGPKIVLSYRYSSDLECDIKVVNLQGDNILFRNNPLAGVRVLFAVVKLQPRKVKLFGFDFYASKSDYHKKLNSFLQTSSYVLGHNKLEADNLKEISKAYRSVALLRHDPVSNFCFAQNLYKAGLFTAEPYCTSILELTPYQYVERLEEMLGDW